MVCMIADYRENGVDMHNEFIAPHTDDYEKAVYALADVLERQGLSVSCITVCPGAKSFVDLHRMEDEGIKPGNVYLPFVFDDGVKRLMEACS
jgi:predicted metal-dependent enzyme (double-stranded beta helix superfamily)